MTREEAYNRIDAIIARHEIDDEYVTITSIKDYDALRMAREILGKEPSGDCISRQAVLDCQRFIYDETGEELEVILAENVLNLPPVTPQPKMGRWIIVDDCEKFIAKCSECGRIEDSRMISKYHYCHCGAKMQEVEENGQISNI